MQNVKKKEESDVALLITIITFTGLLTFIALPRLDVPLPGQNAAIAQSTLRTISTASETYAQGHDGHYPKKIEDLVMGDIPYLSINYCTEGTKGYTYQCNLFGDGYEFLFVLFFFT